VSKLVEALFPLPDYRRTPATTLWWWESRRLFYNRVVGTTGLFTLAGVSVLFALPRHSSPIPLPVLIAAPLAYGAMANLCYTLGWCVEMAARLLWGREAPDLGPILYRQGVIFSVGLTLFPLALAMMLWVLRVVVFALG